MSARPARHVLRPCWSARAFALARDVGKLGAGPGFLLVLPANDNAPTLRAPPVSFRESTLPGLAGWLARQPQPGKVRT